MRDPDTCSVLEKSGLNHRLVTQKSNVVKKYMKKYMKSIRLYKIKTFIILMRYWCCKCSIFKWFMIWLNSYGNISPPFDGPDKSGATFSGTHNALFSVNYNKKLWGTKSIIGIQRTHLTRPTQKRNGSAVQWTDPVSHFGPSKF